VSRVARILRTRCNTALLSVLVLAAVPCGYGQQPAGRPPATLPPADYGAMQQATNDLQAGHSDAAIAGFEHVTHDAPHFAEGFLDLALAYEQKNDEPRAAAALERSIALKPTLRGAHLFLAISQYKLNQLEPAAATIVKETALDPADAQAWMWQGIIDLSLGRLATAVEALDHASTLDPKNVDILYHRGRAALALSRASYEMMFKLDPNSWHVHQVLAQADVEQDRDTDAVEQYRLAIASAPVQGGLYEAMGSSLWRTGKFEEAEQAFETALKIDPTDSLTMYKLGCLRIDRGDAAGGKPLLDKVIVQDPSLKLSSYYLGRAEAELGDDTKAVADFKKVIADDIDFDTTKQAWFQLSRSYRKLHDADASAAAQAEYRRLDQQSKDAMQEKLNQHRLRGDRDTGIPAPASPSAAETP
jgi:tetratricopeptide (TPR) repeat protein